MDFSIKVCLFYPVLQTLNHMIGQEVSEVFDLYTRLHGARVSFFGPDRTLLYPDATSRPNCTYCRLLREQLGLDSRCRDLDSTMMERAREKHEMVSYTCHAGMREAVAPLFVDGQLAGFVMIGQFRSQSAPRVSPYAEPWREKQGGDDLQRAFAASTILPEEKIETLLAMFSRLLELIIRGHLIHRKDFDLIGPVIDRMRREPARAMSLKEAARMTGRSPSTVTRLFKKMTGRSFKQYQTELRLQLAAELLEMHPNLPVGEVARQIGIEDPFYFSRLFHKHSGFSPTEYRETRQRR